MIGDGRIDVDDVDIRVLEQLFEIRVAPLHPEGLADGVQLFRRALANRIHVGIGMALVNGDEFGSESESDDGNVQFPVTHKRPKWAKLVHTTMLFAKQLQRQWPHLRHSAQPLSTAKVTHNIWLDEWWKLSEEQCLMGDIPDTMRALVYRDANDLRLETAP